MDRSWMKAKRISKEYEDGIEKFLEFPQRNAPSKRDGLYYCPCVKCLSNSRRNIYDIKEHLICNGINLRNTNWIWHGEIRKTTLSANEKVVNEDFGDRISDMFRDIRSESST